MPAHSSIERTLRIWRDEDVRFDFSDGAGRPLASGTSPESVAIDRIWRQTRANWAGGRDEVLKVGAALWSFLPSPLKSALADTIGLSLSENRPLLLRIECEEPGLRELPWEWLNLVGESPFDPAEGPLALVPNVRVARNSERPSIFDETELRVLIVTADPGSSRYPKLPWLDAEARSIAAAFQATRRRGIRLETLSDAMMASFEAKLREFRPHVVHFAGHGESRPSGGVVALNGAEAGRERLVPGADFARWLVEAGTQLIFLSACDTAGTKNSVAEALVRAGVPTIVGMQTPIPDAAQPHFARVFYGALLSGSSVDEAIAEARQGSGSSTAWSAAVLYTRGVPFSFFEAQSSLKASPNNLPRFEFSLVGRETETDDVIRLVLSNRLTTLVGPGGIGKTHLAIEAAALTMDAFPDGVWRVVCEACATADDVLFAILRTLELESDQGTPQERIDRHLAGRRLLLVLDCFEGVVASEGQSVVDELLEGSDVSLLITSRFRLGLASETVFEVLPLDRSGDHGRNLLIKVAKRENAAFSEKEEKGLRNISEILEGVPLALIIAAGRLRFVEISELERLLRENPLATLGGRGSGVSLAIRRSLSLIDTADIDRLMDLVVFAGTFSVADVKEIYPDEEFEMLDGLVRLADHSLIQPDGDGINLRYRILDALREYLSASREINTDDERAKEARKRHLDLFSRRAQETADLMGKGRWSEATRTLWDALPNFRLALKFAVDSDRFDEVELLSRSLVRTLMEAGMWLEFQMFSDAGKQVATLADRPRLASFLMSLDGAVKSYRGDLNGAENVWIERLALCRQMGSHAGASDTLIDLALQACGSTALTDAHRWLTEAESEVELSQRDDLRSTFSAVRCMYLDLTGDHAGAAAACEAAQVALERSSFDQQASVNIMLSKYWRKSGDLRRVRQVMGRLLQDSFQAERRLLMAAALSELADSLESERLIGASARCHLAIIAIYRELGYRRLSDAVHKWHLFQQSHSDEYSPAESALFWSDQVRLVQEYLRALEIEKSHDTT